MKTFHFKSFPWFYIFLFLQIVHLVASQTCQCIQPAPSTFDCLGYDSRLQADTIDEAIASFPDLSMSDSSSSEQSDPGCLTQQCQDCRRDMRKQLQKVGLLAQNINDIYSPQVNANSTCTKYAFSLNNQKSHKTDNDSSESDEDEEEEDIKKKKKKHRRDKRQTTVQGSPNATGANLIGTRFTISCALKGVSVDRTGTVSLCSSCWVWRRLPDNYRPKFINELVCDSSDGDCLSGYATCSVGHRTFDAIKYENGVQIQVTLTAGSYCECRISKSSSLQSLVTGTGISGTFNPLIDNTRV